MRSVTLLKRDCEKLPPPLSLSIRLKLSEPGRTIRFHEINGN